jgi:mediator of RNA polymerase II transcription subunit 18
MLEYFLTAYVPDDMIDLARAVLQGVCGMFGEHEFKRVLFYPGPDRPDGFKKVKTVEKSPNKASFDELRRYLAKQSFILRLEYSVREQEFGSVAQSQTLDQRKGTLKWADLPDPVLGDVLHINRKTLTIEDQDNLISLVEQNGHT